MKYQVAAFAGEVPKTIPRLLPENYSQLAVNCKLDDGALTPIRQGRLVKHLDADAAAIFRQGDAWLSWPVPVDVVPGPVASERLYITGDGAPKIRVGATQYDLAVPAPTIAPAPVGSAADPDQASTVLYTYTWVTEFDEESEPAPSSQPISWSNGTMVTVKFFGTVPAGRGINRMRIYRSQTSALGETNFYLIQERMASTNDFFDYSFPFAEPLPSLEYNSPPSTLRGIIALPNGMMAAFSGKDLLFCEPYIPHAWPEKYVLTTDYEIVGLGAFGSSIAVLTKGTPYIVTGSAPENMTMEKLELNLPCINKRGIVDLGYSVAYPSHGGLVMVSSSGANVITDSLMTRDQWVQMNPYSFVASQFSGRYMASYAYQDQQGTEQRGIIIIDPAGGRPFISRSSDFSDAMFYEIETGTLFILKDKRDIYEWDAASEPYGEMTWVSKRMVLQTFTNFGAILVEGDDIMTPKQREALAAKNAALRAKNKALIDSGMFGGALSAMELGLLPLAGTLLAEVDDETPTMGLTVIADGREVAYVSTLNDVARLPSGFLAKTWEIAVRGNVQVTGIILASTPTEIAEG